MSDYYQKPEQKAFHYVDRKRGGGGAIINSLEDISEEALGELKLWIEQAGLSLPVSSIQGYARDAPQQAFTPAGESTSSTTYTDLATVGPEITNLSAGRYLAIFGCIYDSASGSDGFMSPSVNGAVPIDNDAAYAKASVANRYNIVRGLIVTLSGSNTNTITMKYRVSGTTNSFENRWLVLTRVSNA